MIGRLGTLALLAILAGLSIWLTQEIPEGIDRGPLVRGTDGYFEGVEFSGTDSEGRLSYRLSAARAEHHAERDAIMLTAVDIVLMEAGEPAWSVVANSGLAPAVGHEIYLDGDVRMHRTGVGDDFQILGQSFTLSPDSEIATSVEAVEVRIGTQVLTGVGFQADFDTGSMRLLSQVHARYTDAG